MDWDYFAVQAYCAGDPGEAARIYDRLAMSWLFVEDVERAAIAWTLCGLCEAAMKTKTCTTCKVTKDVNLFGRSRGEKDGFAARCLQCARKQQDQWRRNGGRLPASGSGWASLSIK